MIPLQTLASTNSSLAGNSREGQLQPDTQLPSEAEIMSHFANLMTY